MQRLKEFFCAFDLARVAEQASADLRIGAFLTVFQLDGRFGDDFSVDGYGADTLFAAACHGEHAAQYDTCEQYLFHNKFFNV